MKSVIFDIDFTLMEWKPHYINALKKTLREYCLLNEFYLTQINTAIETQEYKYPMISRVQLLKDINKICALNLDISFIDRLFDNQALLGEHDERLVKTISNLSYKYQLIIFSNYFKEVQDARLKHTGIYDYFTRFYYGDYTEVKPSTKSLLKILNSEDPRDFYMVGDNYKMDIEPAITLGLNAILIDGKNKCLESKQYTKIKTIYDVEKVL